MGKTAPELPDLAPPTEEEDSDAAVLRNMMSGLNTASTPPPLRETMPPPPGDNLPSSLGEPSGVEMLQPLNIGEMMLPPPDEMVPPSGAPQTGGFGDLLEDTPAVPSSAPRGGPGSVASSGDGSGVR